MHAVEQDPLVEGALGGVRFTVDWCRNQMDEAIVLHAGKRALDPDAWPPDVRDEVAAKEAELNRRIRRLTGRLVEVTGLTGDEVLLAVVDVPYAVVRRHLASGEPPPPRATALAVNGAQKLLEAP